MSTSDSPSEQPPLWGLPDRPQDLVRKGGSVLVVRLSPELSKALQEASDETMIDRLVLRILNEWAGISQVSTTTDDDGTLSQPIAAEGGGHD